jgi:hypothetical protein
MTAREYRTRFEPGTLDGVADQEALLKVPDRPCSDALQLLSQLTVTEQLATVLAQRTEDEDFA